MILKPESKHEFMSEVQPLLIGMGAVLFIVGFVALVFVVQGEGLTEIRSWAREPVEEREPKLRLHKSLRQGTLQVELKTK